MKMSEIRKKIQAGLRRQYKYSSNNNYGRGAIIGKSAGESYSGYKNGVLYHSSSKDAFDPADRITDGTDVNLVLNHNSHDMEIILTHYRQKGEGSEWEKTNEERCSFSYDEITAIYLWFSAFRSEQEYFERFLEERKKSGIEWKDWVKENPGPYILNEDGKVE